MNGRRVRQKKGTTERDIVFEGPGSLHKRTIKVVSGIDAREDERWVLITEKKNCGTRHYLCVRCGAQFCDNPSGARRHSGGGSRVYIQVCVCILGEMCVPTGCVLGGTRVYWARRVYGVCTVPRV